MLNVFIDFSVSARYFENHKKRVDPATNNNANRVIWQLCNGMRVR